MTLPIFPVLQGLGYDVKWTPVFFTQSQKTLTGASIDIALASTPLWQFELVYNFLRDPGTLGASKPASFDTSEFRILMGFFLSLGGSAGRFLFQNPDDFAVLGQPIATYDGSATSWPIVRTLGDVFYGTEPIGQIKAAGPTPVVYFSGVPATLGTDYQLDVTPPTNPPGNNVLELLSSPPNPTPITMDFNFYYYCRFSDPTLTFNKFVSQVWAGQSIKIESCRVNA